MTPDQLLSFVLGGGLLAVVGAFIYAWKEIRAGKVAAKKGDLDSLKDIMSEQRTEMADLRKRTDDEMTKQRTRYDTRITDLEEDLKTAEQKARTTETAALSLRRHLVRLEAALRSAGIDVPEWQET